MKVKILSVVLVAIGLLQSLGYLIGSKEIKQLGAVSVASPLPIVFTQQKGFLETFALEFTLVYHQNGIEKRLQITPELYSKLDKPYNYRNVLGAAISYGPILPKPLVDSVLAYAFTDPGVLTQAFGIEEFDKAHIELRSKTRGVDKRYILPLGEKR